jgi:RND family efflux transporter MFP subunit
MIRFRRVYGTAVAALVPLLAACGTEEPVQEAVEAEPGGGEAITLWTDRTELFFEYPAMIAGTEGGAWAIHLTDLSDFRPVTEGRLSLVFEGPDGRSYTVVQDEPARPGVYNPTPSLPVAGMYDLVMLLEGPQVEDEIFVGPVQVFGSAEELPRLPEAEAVGISFLKEQQWPIDFATVEAVEQVVAPGVAVTGELAPEPGRMAEITAPVAGIVRWDLNRGAPAEGTWVPEGQPLLRLSPVPGDATYAALRREAARLEREVARAERLAAAEAVPLRRLEEARGDLEVVRAQLDALDSGDADGYVLSLASPIAGAVVERLFVPGERVEPGQPLLRLVDPRVMHLVLHVPAAHAQDLGATVAATFRVEGSNLVQRTERLVGVGAVLDPERRSVPVTFQVANPDRSLRSGMLVTGRLLRSAPEPTLAVPAEAVVDEDGLLVAYVQIGGETFERRAVTVGVTDGQWTTVLAGVRRGERVVIRGHYPIKLSSLNTSEISDHGHPH